MNAELIFRLGLFFLSVAATGVLTTWVPGLIYGIIRTPAIYFPFTLAVKMTAAAVAGFLLLGFGAIAAATAVFVFEFKKRNDFVMWKSIVIGGIVSSISIITTLFATYLLAAKILD